MTKLEQIKQVLSNAGSDKRFIDGFENGAIWTITELTDFLSKFLSCTDYKYIDNNSMESFLYNFRNHITDKKTE